MICGRIINNQNLRVRMSLIQGASNRTNKQIATIIGWNNNADETFTIQDFMAFRSFFDDEN